MYTLEILNGTNWEHLFQCDSLQRISMTIKVLSEDTKNVYTVRVLENDKVISFIKTTKIQYEWFLDYFVKDNSLYKKLEKRK